MPLSTRVADLQLKVDTAIDNGHVDDEHLIARLAVAITAAGLVVGNNTTGGPSQYNAPPRAISPNPVETPYTIAQLLAGVSIAAAGATVKKRYIFNNTDGLLHLRHGTTAVADGFLNKRFTLQPGEWVEYSAFAQDWLGALRVRGQNMTAGEAVMSEES